MVQVWPHILLFFFKELYIASEDIPIDHVNFDVPPQQIETAENIILQNWNELKVVIILVIATTLSSHRK